ncbi:MAG: hypothetical protein RLZZ381_3000 [Cyanobacteriota bacterium]|jgi:Ca2+-binding RTX toxin-like protein
MAIISGSATQGNDSIVADQGADYIDALAGNDTVDSGGGVDSVFAGDGDDLVYARAGNDSLSGGAGKDYLLGYGGNDYITGDNGNDTLKGGNGNDTLRGEFGRDTLYGERGKDIFQLGDGNYSNDDLYDSSDTIFDFVDGSDKILLTNGLTFEDLTMDSSGFRGAIGTTISISGGSIADLVGVDSSLITSDDFSLT